MRGDTDLVKQMLRDRIADLCRELLPEGKLQGGKWMAPNPFDPEAHKHVPALKVGVRGDPGAWTDWRMGRNGAPGDVIGLIMWRFNCDFGKAMQWARDWLGIRDMGRAERERLAEKAKARAKQHERDQAKARAFKLERAADLFQRGLALGAGSPAEALARDYFLHRDCALENVAALNPDTFRFSGATEWWNGAKWQNDHGRRFKVEPGPSYPAIHTAMRSATGVVTCCHCTFLDPLKPAKAPVSPPKLMFGEALGAAIEIAMGPEAKPFWQASVPHPLILAEGIETALSIAAIAPDARVWAGGSLIGMGHVPAGLPCIASITVARDNNDGNQTANSQLGQSLARLQAHGKPMVVMASHVGDDFNDLAQGEDDEQE